MQCQQKLSDKALGGVLLVVLLGLATMSLAQEGAWTQKADMPTARYGPGSAVVEGRIYVIGGARVSQGRTAVVEAYDPATDTWTTRTSMPTARQGVVAAAVDGIIYAMGGWATNTVFSRVQAYEPATDTWTTKAAMPTARTLAAAAVVDGWIYVMGGNDKNGRTLRLLVVFQHCTSRQACFTNDNTQ